MVFFHPQFKTVLLSWCDSVSSLCVTDGFGSLVARLNEWAQMHRAGRGVVVVVGRVSMPSLLLA